MHSAGTKLDKSLSLCSERATERQWSGFSLGRALGSWAPRLLRLCCYSSSKSMGDKDSASDVITKSKPNIAETGTKNKRV